MNRFGLPLLPAGLAIWVVDFADRLLLGRIVDQHEVGLYAVGVKIASAMVLVQLAFRTAWPAFAYSLEEGPRARRTFAYVLTYTSLLGMLDVARARAAGAVAGRLLAAPEFAAAEQRGGAARLLRRAAGRVHDALHRRLAREPHATATGRSPSAGAVVNVALNLLLIPDVRHGGAAAATVAAYVVLAAGMALLSQRIYPVPYEWRRLTVATGAGMPLYALGRRLDVPLAGALALTAAYPRAAGRARVLSSPPSGVGS